HHHKQDFTRRCFIGANAQDEHCPIKDEDGGNKLSPLRKTVCGIDRKGDRQQDPAHECDERYIQPGSNIGIDFFHPSNSYRHDEEQKEDMFLKTKEPWEERQQCDSGEPVHLQLPYQRAGMKTTCRAFPGMAGHIDESLESTDQNTGILNSDPEARSARLSFLLTSMFTILPAV